MPVTICPHCGRGSDFLIGAQVSKQTDAKINWAVGSCRLCKKEVWFELHKDNPEQIMSSWPTARESAAAELPDNVRRALDEAFNCYSVEAWNGTLCMCRRAIQDALIQLGAPTKGNLPTQLKALVDTHKITPDLKDWADQARIGGKLAAHGTGGDEWGDPDKDWADRDDATQVIEFCRSFFEYAYVMKARLQRRQSGTPASQSRPSSNEP